MRAGLLAAHGAAYHPDRASRAIIATKQDGLEDEQDLRKERIGTFARLLVSAYGFKGSEAEREREQIVRALEENRDPIDYVGLRQRARRYLQSSEIRQVLTEAGLPDHEFDAVLRESSTTSPV